MSYHALNDELYMVAGWLYKVVDGELVKDKPVYRGCNVQASSDSLDQGSSTAAQKETGCKDAERIKTVNGSTSDPIG